MTPSTFSMVFRRLLFDFRFILAYNCAEIYKSGARKDGVYTIQPDNLSAFDVFCDQTTAGGGWTVFQKRLNGSVDFYLNWSDYKVGFGDLDGEFWLGLDKIHRLTSDDNSMLRVDLEDFEGNTAYAEYNNLSVKNENDLYRLNLASYSGKMFFFLRFQKRIKFRQLNWRQEKTFTSGLILTRVNQHVTY